MDTAVSKLFVFCDCFELCNLTVELLVFLGNLISFLPGKGKKSLKIHFSAVFENLFDCSNQLSVHLQWQQRGSAKEGRATGVSGVQVWWWWNQLSPDTEHCTATHRKVDGSQKKPGSDIKGLKDV